MANQSNKTNSLNTAIYIAIFIITQFTGLLLSLSICFILQDFVWGFMRMATLNSLILGLSLVSCCFLSQNLIFKLKTLYIILISFLVLLGTSIISFFILLIRENSLFVYYNRGAFTFLFINFLFIVTLYFISSGLIVSREIVLKNEKKLGKEKGLKNQMEMKLLSSKVNPHFLFNTLNMIVNLLKRPEKAELALLNLSDLLRHNLDFAEKEEVSVTEEINNVEKYLEIQKLRFEEKLNYSITLESEFSIPPLIIQPLVENSIKHNMNRVDKLQIDIKVDTNRKIIVLDSEKRVEPTMLKKGHGLTITQKRVENSGGKFTISNGGIEIDCAKDTSTAG